MTEEHRDWKKREITTDGSKAVARRLRWIASMIEEHGVDNLSLDETWEPPKFWKDWDGTWLFSLSLIGEVQDTLTDEALVLVPVVGTCKHCGKPADNVFSMSNPGCQTVSYFLCDACKPQPPSLTCVICGPDDSAEKLFSVCSTCGYPVCDGCRRGTRCYLCENPSGDET